MEKADNTVKAMSDLLSEMAQTLNVIGYRRAKSAIRQARDNFDPSIELNRLIEKFIIRETCIVFRVPMIKLKDKKSRGNRPYCIMVISALLKKHLNYELKDTHKAIGVHFTHISRLLTQFNELNDKSARQSLIKKHYHDLDKLVAAYDEQIKLTVSNESTA